VQDDRLISSASIDISPDAIARAKLSSTGKTRIIRVVRSRDRGCVVHPECHARAVDAAQGGANPSMMPNQVGLRLGSTKPLCHLQEPAERIRKLYLSMRATLGLEDLRRTDQDRDAPRPGCRDVQPVQAVEELHPTRRVGMAGRSRGVNRDGASWPCNLSTVPTRAPGRCC